MLRYGKEHRLVLNGWRGGIVEGTGVPESADRHEFLCSVTRVPKVYDIFQDTDAD